MNIKMLSAFAGVAAAGALWASEPVISDVTIAQDASRRVTIEYKLSAEPGIVTVEILTNGVPINGVFVDGLTGDANKVVDVTGVNEKRTIYWKPEKSWPDQKFTTPVVSARLTAWATNAPPDYMVVDLKDGDIRYYTTTDYLPAGGLKNDIYRKSKMVFRRIHAANVETVLGASTSECQWMSAAQKAHRVRFSKDYYIGIYEVTQAQYAYLMNARPSFFTNPEYADMRPVENSNYNKYRGGAWCPSNKAEPASGTLVYALRQLTGGQPFDLPTECQWEYACRGGSDAEFYNGKSFVACTPDRTTIIQAGEDAAKENLNLLARYGGDLNATDANCSTNEGTAIVGSYQPNDWGLYDTLGNVSEICLDRVGYDSQLRTWSTTEILDPVSSEAQGPEVPSAVVAKGGSWRDRWHGCRPAAVDTLVYNWNSYKYTGVRLALTLP